MKLRNKKTGEIAVFGEGIIDLNQIGCKNVAEMMEAGWEDVPEEPKEYWAIDCFSPDGELVSQFGKCSERIIENRKQIGNYFETKEEAEKAVEKLKAWQRLRDKGFRLNNWDLDADDEDVNVLLSSDTYKGYKIYDFAGDLDLLFGGEDDN